MKIHLRPAIVFALIGLAACEPSSSEVVVARAADRTLTADQVVQILSSRPDLPNDPQVVEAVSELWIDHTLFALALNEDPLLLDLDLESLVESQVEQEMILALREAVVQPDTAISETELAELFEREGPGVQATASHILLTTPQAATPEERDSVRAATEALRQRVLEGESFEEVARRFSQDRGSAGNGGSLGSFGRGELVRSLDEAIFSLEPGEISEVVGTPFGFHVVRLDALEAPELDSVAEQFRGQVQARRFQEAESVYIAELQEAANLRPEEDAVELVRQFARDPSVQLSGRARSRALMRYDGGQVTLSELREFMQTRDPDFRSQVLQASDEVVRDQVLAALAQRELLVTEAREQGLDPGPARRDSLTTRARDQFVEVGQSLGLVDLELSGNGPDGLTRAVRAILEGIVEGERQVVPLGPIPFVLRGEYRSAVNEAGVATVVTRLAALRGPAPAPGPTGAPLPGMPPAVDTGGVRSDSAGAAGGAPLPDPAR